jgi:hypothetical protein
MPIHLSVQAEVIDICSDVPRQQDIFLVDTNVWLWQTYANSIASDRSVQTIRAYTAYLKQARVNGATLAYSGLILAELAHVIERTEREIFAKRTRQKWVKSKDYRHNYLAERANVVAEVESAWDQIERFAVPVELTVNDEVTRAALARFKTQAIDGYDLLLIEAISRAGAGQIRVITDDMDYAVVPGIQVFTNNNSVIQQATAQGKLLTVR